MGTTKRSDLIYLDILQQAISVGFTGMKALFGTGAAALVPGLPTLGASGAPLKGGDTIRVPYFGNLGELDDVAEGGALVPVKVSETSETSTVVHSGKAGEITDWATLSAMFSDPYAEYGRQFAEAWKRRIDKGLIDKAAATSLIYDASGGSAGAQYFTWTNYQLGRSQWGDEENQGDVVAMVMHSKVYADAKTLADTTGRPLFFIDQSQNDLTTIGGLPRIGGTPVILSDRVAVSGSGANSAIYDTLLVKRGALVAWYNGEPTVESDRDILAASQLTALHTYHVEHLYGKMPGLTKPGVVRLKTKAST